MAKGSKNYRRAFGGKPSNAASTRHNNNSNGNNHHNNDSENDDKEHDGPKIKRSANLDTTTSRLTTYERRLQLDQIDLMNGYEILMPEDQPRMGWLLNMVNATVEDPSTRKTFQIVDLFFIGADGRDFRASHVVFPYLYVAAYNDQIKELEIALLKVMAELILKISVVDLQDLSQSNHLVTQPTKPFLKIETRSSNDLFQLRNKLRGIMDRNKSSASASKTHHLMQSATTTAQQPHDSFAKVHDALALISDIREHDVAYVNRVAIDTQIRVGYWYHVKAFPMAPAGVSTTGETTMSLNSSRRASKAPMLSCTVDRIPSIIERANPIVFAFDIETTKPPLKFPDAHAGDSVMMISWMVDGRGYLGVNRSVVSQDIEDFEYSPKPEFLGDFQVFNEPDEKSLLACFFEQVRKACPRVFVTYNGDFFDWPFVKARAEFHGMSMFQEIGMDYWSTDSDECLGRGMIHMDCFHWVNRDSYLPQGSRGLKAVTRALLGYDPLELDPEEMLPAAKSQPQLLASYSVSDAVCTYYLYMRYVHPFIFSLSNIIPLSPDDVLRKGSGTLCESLLMSEARDRKIVAPDKSASKSFRETPEGKMLESETYIGGHVEALKTGIFRSDIPMKFQIDPLAIQELVQNLDKVIKFTLEDEAKWSMDDVMNLDEVKASLLSQLEALRAFPERMEKPLIYHLDVGAMYPNIILTNRLQPHAMVSAETCAACDFNGTADCKRFMQWTWRGETYAPNRGEVQMLKRTITQEQRLQLDEAEIDRMLKERIKEYSRRAYKRIVDTTVQERTATACQRENPFYVDTVRAFRDRRYEYKQLLKQWKKKLGDAEKHAPNAQLTAADISARVQEAKSMVVLYESMQLAHKCILNSFYGYVMRKGARWYSMEMAGVVTQTGANIICEARKLIERIGMALELDTDGIWCTIPSSFPENFVFQSKSGKKHTMSYLCSVFNYDVNQKFSNHQYQTLMEGDNNEYKTSSECSIYFEVDGPYKAMVLPASKEEGKSIKKRYAVFNHDGSIAELKGFEIKRRGELKLIKIFQGDIFKSFLLGSTLPECYAQVASFANRWLDVLDQRGEMLSDTELIELVMEQSNMSRTLEEYVGDNQKSCAITCAKRLSDFLGPQMVRDKGLACKYIIATKPEGLQVTERAIPVEIFKSDEKTRTAFLKRWLKTSGFDELSLREIIDWDYYRTRLGSAILKIISIPAILQGVPNPVERVPLPDWLIKRNQMMSDPHQQSSLLSFFQKTGTNKSSDPPARSKIGEAAKLVHDIEDINVTRPLPVVAKVTRALKEPVDHPEVISVEPNDKLKEPTPAIHYSIRDYPNWLASSKQKWLKNRRSKMASGSNTRKRRRDTTDFDLSNLESLDGELPDSRRRRLQGIGKFFPHLSKDATAKISLQDPHDVFNMPSGGKFNPFASMVPVGDVFLTAHESSQWLMSSNWHVISVQEGSIPGELRLWILPYATQLKSDHGPFRVGEITSVKVLMNRTVYVHAWQALDTSLLDRYCVSWQLSTKKILPRGKARHFLYELVVSESLFRCLPHDLSNLLYSSAVEGIYGTQASLRKQFITSLGSIVMPKASVVAERRKNSAGGKKEGLVLQMSELESVQAQGNRVSQFSQAKPVPYLASFDKIVSYAYLFESRAEDQSGRGVLALISAKLKQCHVILVAPSPAANQLNVDKVWQDVSKETYHQISSDSERMRKLLLPGLEDLSKYSVHVKMVKKSDDAMRELGLALSRLREASASSKRTVLCVQATHGYETLLKSISILRSFPAVCIPFHADATMKFPTLQWELPIIKGCFSQYLEYGSLLFKHVDLAAYARVPICNISLQDPEVCALDAIFGRELHNKDVISWSSEGVKPDLGGHEDGDPGAMFSADRFNKMSVAVPGVYRSVCFDIEIQDAVVAAITGSDYFADVSARLNMGPSSRGANDSPAALLFMMQTDKNGPKDSSKPPSSKKDLTSKVLSCPASKDTSVLARKAALMSAKLSDKPVPKHLAKRPSHASADDLQSGMAGFRALKDMVAGLDKVAQSSSGSGKKSSCAQALLDHVYRWVSSESSLYYEPAVFNVVQSFLERLFELMVSEFTRLGAKIIHATPSRLILASPRIQVVDALKYAAFLESAVRGHPTIQRVRFAPVTGVYISFMFVDPFNYAGVPAIEEDAVRDGDTDALDCLSASLELDTISELIPPTRFVWDMGRYLPNQVCMQLFKLVSMFLRNPVLDRYLSILAAKSASQGANIKFALKNDGLVAEVTKMMESLSEHAFIQVSLIQEQEQHRLFRSFVPPPSKRKVQSPTLEFINLLGHVMKMDTIVHEKARSLHTDLLHYIRVREFSSQAEFSNPAQSLKLSDLVCAHCGSISDLDVTALRHEPRLESTNCAENISRGANSEGTDSEEPDSEVPPAAIDGDDSMCPSWSCAYCDCAYPAEVVEMRLVRELQLIILAFQTQDVRCKRCKLVNRENMNKLCSGCTGALNFEMDQQELLRKMLALKQIARQEQFLYLEHLLEGVV